MTKKMRWTAAVLALLITVVMAAGVLADSAIDPDRNGSITVTLHDTSDEHNIVYGAAFTLYKAGSIVLEGTAPRFELTEEFEGSGASLDDLNAEGLADSLKEYAEDNAIPGITNTAGEDGAVVFDGLDLGLYLIVQAGELDGYYHTGPFIVAIPMTSADGSEWLYDIEASPKAEAYEPQPTEYTEITVIKVWEDAEGEAHPDSVTVQLLMDGEPYATAVLNDENGWTYTWTELPKEHSWTVIEQNVPSGYAVTYRYTDEAVIVTNTAKLIQTGQLNWPIPVLASAGVVLFAAGWVMCLKSNKNKNEQ